MLAEWARSVFSCRDFTARAASLTNGVSHEPEQIHLFDDIYPCFKTFAASAAAFVSPWTESSVFASISPTVLAGFGCGLAEKFGTGLLRLAK